MKKNPAIWIGNKANYSACTSNFRYKLYCCVYCVLPAEALDLYIKSDYNPQDQSALSHISLSDRV